MGTLEKRYSELIKNIGHERLMNLPEKVKDVLKGVTRLDIKVEVLEAIYNRLENN